MLIETLKEMREKVKIVSVYSDKFNTDKFTVGYIIGLNEDYYIIALISPSGMYDGYRLALISDIYRIEYNGKYENKIRLLYDYKNQKHDTMNFAKENLMNEFLTFAKNKNFIVTIELCDSNLDDIQGYIKEIKEETIIINCIDNYGYFDEVSIINLENITSIVCNSEDENILKILSNINKNN